MLNSSLYFIKQRVQITGIRMTINIIPALILFVIVTVFSEDGILLVKEHGTINITLSTRQEFIKYVTCGGKVVTIGDKNNISSQKENIRVLEVTNVSINFSIDDVEKNQAGKYCLNNKTNRCHLLIVTGAPVVNLTSTTTTMSCTAKSTSKPNNNNLTMMYTWFQDGQVLQKSNRSILYINSTIDPKSITCVATDDPRCKNYLKNSRLTDDSVLKDEKCDGVLGESKYEVTDIKTSSAVLSSTASSDVSKEKNADIDSEELMKLVFITVSITLVIVVIVIIIFIIKFSRERTDVMIDPRVNVSAAFMNHFYTRSQLMARQHHRNVEGLNYADLDLRVLGMKKQSKKPKPKDTISYSEFDFSKVVPPPPTSCSSTEDDDDMMY